jgi:hypothetical protein
VPLPAPKTPEVVKETPNLELKPQPKVSVVWKHFTKCPNWSDTKEKFATCNHCEVKTAIPCKDSSTTGCIKHLKQHHFLTYANSFGVKLDKSQKSLAAFSFPGIPGKVQMVSTSDDVRKKLVHFIIDGEHTFIIVEEEAFRDLLLCVHRLPKTEDLKLYGADSMKRDVMKLYLAKSLELKQILFLLKSKLSFTTDMWTDLKLRGFMGITAHWISEDWKLISITLDFVEVPGSHSAETLAHEFSQIVFEKFGLKDKIMCITVDNVECNTKMLKTLEAVHFGENLTELQAQWKAQASHIRCFAHIINLAVNAGLSVIEPKIRKLRELIKKLKVSSILSHSFEESCKYWKVEFLKPKLDCPTRWSSTATMLARAIQLRKVLSSMTSPQGARYDSRLVDSDLTSMEWEEVEAAFKFCRMFEKICTKVQGDKYVTISSIIPYFNLLLDKLEQISFSERSTPLGSAAGEAFAKLDKYYQKTNDTHTIAVVLDPRIRLAYHETLDNGVDEAKKVVTACYNKYKAIWGEHQDTVSDQSDEEDDIWLFKKKKFEASTTELGSYFEGSVGKEVDPLSWWSENQKRFPILSRMARDYLAIPATSAPSERLFSQAGRTISEQRNRLKGDTACALLCLKSWNKVLENLK